MVSCAYFFYTFSMNLVPVTYIPRNSIVHRADARIKLLLLITFSVSLFLVSSWQSMVLLCALLLVLWVASKIPFQAIGKLCIPLWIILGIIFVCNSLTFDVSGAQNTFDSLPDVNKTLMLGTGISLAPIPLFGSVGFVPTGALVGLYYVIRIIVLFIASFLVVLSTTSEDLVAGFNSLIRPLSVFRIPTDDLATIFSIALRFIPLIAQEAYQIKQAQLARCAQFGTGGLWARISAWFPVMIPLFVGLFRKADSLSAAMDARCYGYSAWKRNSSDSQKIRRSVLRVSSITCSSVAAGVGLFAFMLAVVIVLG